MSVESEKWRELLPAKAVYTFFDISFSCVLNFLPVFFNSYFNKFEIGVIQTLPCLAYIIAPPLWGAIADVLQKQRLIHILCIISGSLLMYSIQFVVPSFTWTCVMVFLANFQSTPLWPLLDQAILALVTELGAEFGKQRLYGAVGYGIGAYLAGLFVANYGISWAFNLNVIFAIPMILSLSFIPSPDQSHELSPSSAKAASPSFISGLGIIMKKKDVLGLLFVTLLGGIMFGIITAFLTLNLYELSNSNAQIVGIAIACETTSELPAFYYADRIIDKLGTVKVLAISILAYGARLTCYALMTNPWVALPFEFLHGCTYGLAFAASTKYVYAEAPRGTEGVMMGVLSAMQNGFGRGIGTIFGGYLYNNYGPSFMWTVADLGVPVALVGLYMFSCSIPSHEPKVATIKHKELVLAKVVYTVFSFGSSSVLNFLPVYFNTYFDKFQIGLLQTIPCICSIISPPLWGAIADVLQKQRLVHIFCLVSAAVLMYSIQFGSSNFTWTCILVFLANFQSQPLWPLMDQAILALVTRLGAEYGKQRLYGAVGWGTGAYVTGLIVANFGIAWAFNTNAIACIPTLLLLQMLPSPDAPELVDSSKAKATTFSEGVRLVMGRRDILGLLLVVFLAGIMFGALSAFLTLNLYELSHGNAQIVGIAIFCETFSELPAFYFADTIIEKLGTVKVLAISILAYGARLTCYALMTNPWVALPFEFLHGCTYGLGWAASTKYVFAEVPRGTEGMMMGILSGVQTGLGRGVGTFVGGYLYNTYSASFMWTVADCFVPISLIGLYIFSCTMPNHDITTPDEKKQLLYFETKTSLNLPFNQLPTLRVDDKATYAQSLAIARYASKLAGLYPKEPLIALEADSLVDTISELFNAVFDAVFKTSDDIAREAKFNVLNKEIFPRTLEQLEARVVGPFFTGKITFADIYLFNLARNTMANSNINVRISDYPKLEQIAKQSHCSNCHG
ncbi:Major Facilitator Superfamily (MFS) [Thraustotheca clavata]|uniref:Major Facilitator Superfamily (MFS) n=1 Tax=Thraustotheca clavata TaxID=74557 RepID=A0A1V9ZZ12_9STRA|nr:Major Facilitator Superfamily (MFS) [Thraustotheca clavata]